MAPSLFFRSSDAGQRFSLILHTHCCNAALCLCMQDQAVVRVSSTATYAAAKKNISS